jgi:hypothetical protein
VLESFNTYHNISYADQLKKSFGTEQATDKQPTKTQFNFLPQKNLTFETPSSLPKDTPVTFKKD